MLKLQTAPYCLNKKKLERNIKGINIPVEIRCQSLKRNKKNIQQDQGIKPLAKYLVKTFLNLQRNKLQQDTKSCLNFGRSIIKTKKLAISLNDFVIDQATDKTKLFYMSL